MVVPRADLVEALTPGKNLLVVTLGGRFLVGGERIERSFDYDPSGPRLMVPTQVFDPGNGEAITVRGIADGAARLSANGQPVELDGGGGFTINVAPGTSAVVLNAKDKNGNPTRTRGVPRYRRRARHRRRVG